MSFWSFVQNLYSKKDAGLILNNARIRAGVTKIQLKYSKY